MKKLIILVSLLLTVSTYSQNYEVYVGSVINENPAFHANYMFGANFIIRTNQDRKYLNNLIFGFEHSAMMTGNKTISFNNESSLPIESCNCTEEELALTNNASYTSSIDIRGVSLNLGVSLIKGLYLMTGVTNYQHINKINNETVNEYRTMQIDAGVKYFIKLNKWFIIPMVKFNPETTSFGIGLSYY